MLPLAVHERPRPARPAGWLTQGSLDLGGFDAEAAQLDLVVAAAEEFERAVGAPAREVAGAVEPPQPRHARRTVRRSAPAAPGSRAPARRRRYTARRRRRSAASRRWRRGCSAGCWRSARRSGSTPTPRPGDGVTATEGRALGRTVAVDQPAAGQRRPRPPDVRHRQRLAAHQKLPQPAQRSRAARRSSG